MKKRIILGLLLLLFIPFNISAYSYKGTSITKDTLINNNYIKVWPTSASVPNFYVSNNSYISNTENFYFHSVIQGSNVFVGHSSNIGKLISNTNYELDKIDTFATLENNTNNLTNNQRKLLEDLIINGYQYDTTNTQSVDRILSGKDTTLSMMAMQILVWEIIEGGRTTFTSLEPDNISKSTSAYTYSYYNQLVYPNGGETSESGTLFYYYKRIVNSVNEITDTAASTAFNTDVYSLTWDGTNKKYTTTVNGLGKFNSCVSSDSTVNVSTSGTTAVISSSNTVDLATITCSYAIGGGTNDEFYYFKFKSSGNCTTQGACSNVIYGSGKKVYSKSFGVTSKTSDIKIRNINLDKKNVDGAVFKLTHRTTTNYSVNITANNSTTTNINKSGEYIVTELSVPQGYEQISDFNIRIDTSDNSVKDCTNMGKDSNGNTTCANGRIVVTKDSNVLVLTIISLEKNFKIIKIDENNDVIKGTTFQIKNSKNELMKFKLSDGLFTYDMAGSTDIVSDSGTYAISMLPSDTYSIIETNPVSPYRLPSKEEDRITKIQIDDSGDLLVFDETQKKYTTAINSSVRIKNYRTLVNIISVQNGSPVKGLSYSLYGPDKTTLIKSRLEQDGVYNYLDNQSSSEGTSEYLTDSGGYIHVYDLPVGTYYFKQNNMDNASLIEVRIDVTKDGATVNENKVINTISLSATKNSFSFYKTDEKGNYLSNGQFKLQRYDVNKARYVDLKLIQVENDGTYNEKAEIFKEDDDGKRVFTLKNGIAAFIDMQPGSQYRIVETAPPTGYELQTINDTATVTIDDSGNAYGLLVLSNKQVLAQSGQAQAELIINIDTGQTRIRYAIIIGSIIIIIGALITLQRKKK